MPTYRYLFAYGIDADNLDDAVPGDVTVVACSKAWSFVDVEVDDEEYKGDLDEYMQSIGCVFFEDDPTGEPPALVLQSPDGTMWSVEVSDVGAMSAVSLGPAPPGIKM